MSRPLADHSDASDLTLKTRFLNLLSSGSAVGYYCSALIHLVALGILILLLSVFDVLLLTEVFHQSFSVRGSLADESIIDTLPKLEAVADLEFDQVGGQSVDSTAAADVAISPLGPDMRIDAINSLAGVGSGFGDSAGDAIGFQFKLPEDGRAVTKGSFTAWTDPPNPAAGQRYRIIIQIRLPKRIRRYRSTDLRGKVVGTDGYTQFLPYDKRKRFAAYTTSGDETIIIGKTTKLPVHNHQAQLVVLVPGGANLVRDTITIESRTLKERQILDLVFGSADEPAQPAVIGEP